VDYLTSSVVGVARASRRLYRAHLDCQFWRGEHARQDAGATRGAEDRRPTPHARIGEKFLL